MRFDRVPAPPPFARRCRERRGELCRRQPDRAAALERLGRPLAVEERGRRGNAPNRETTIDRHRRDVASHARRQHLDLVPRVEQPLQAIAHEAAGVVTGVAGKRGGQEANLNVTSSISSARVRRAAKREEKTREDKTREKKTRETNARRRSQASGNATRDGRSPERQAGP